MDLNQLVNDFHKLNQQEKQVKDKKKPVNDLIKQVMKEQGLEKFTSEEGLTASYKEQERVTLNEDKLVNKLNQLGLTKAIVTVEKPDQSEVEELIYNGELDPQILDDCLVKKRVPVLTVKGGKNK